jgi:hypothetical protein
MISFQNAIACGRLHIIGGAIAPDKVAFYSNPSQSLWGTTKAEWALRNEILGYTSERIEFNQVDIAEVYSSHGIPFYLKIDVEGVDRVALEALKMFQDRPRYVSLESEKIHFNKLKAEMELLKSLGYAKFKLVQQENIPGTKIRTWTIDGRPLEYVFGPHAPGPFGDDLPPPWLTYDDALDQYKTVFRRYKLFGDYSRVREMPEKAQKVIRKLYRMRTGYKGPLPGWFDTHASLTGGRSGESSCYRGRRLPRLASLRTPARPGIRCHLRR